MIMKPIHLAIAASCLLASCGENETTEISGSAELATPGSELQSVLATAPTGAAQQIHVVRKTVKPGDEITIGGKIMGNPKPFIDGRAAFTLGDPAILTSCDEIPGDSCSTPWDVCCDSKELKLEGIATVQIVGADGRVLKEGLEGVRGLANLAKVTVSGQVAEGSSPESLVVNATAIQVNP
jgi:hypothetical protein